MKVRIGNILVAIIGLVISSCGQALSLEPTITPTSTSTSPPTQTTAQKLNVTSTLPAKTLPTASKNGISIGLPENPETFIDGGGTLRVPVNESDLSIIVKNSLNADPPVSICPVIWINPLLSEPIPTFALFMSASPADQGQGFMVSVGPTTSGSMSYYVDFGVIPSESSGNFYIVTVYQPSEEHPISDELEVQVVFSGCEIYKILVTWSQ